MIALRRSDRRAAAKRVAQDDVATFHQRHRVALRTLADEILVPASTLHRWCARAPARALSGRPRLPFGRPDHDEVRSAIVAVAARTTVAALKQQFPHITRAVLAAMLRQVRRELRVARRRHLAQLTWRWPGTVWAGDFTHLDARAAALCIRDLPSGNVLHAGIADAESSAIALTTLEGLFEQHGPPLVIKLDNGPAFVAERTKELLAAHDVLPLYSPPGCPAYNGACEAGHRPLKNTAVDLCNLDSGSALEQYLAPAARLLNDRPRGCAAGADSAAQIWSARTPLPARLRQDLARRRAHHLRVRSEASGIAERDRPDHALAASLDRYAIREALFELDLLLIRRP